MLEISELEVTCKTVVRIFQRSDLLGEIVSRDLSVDRTTRNKREEGLYLNFSVARLVNLSLKSTPTAPALSDKEGKDRKNTQMRSRENWQGREKERSSKRQQEKERGVSTVS